jgi:hypothetical protein
LGSGNGFPQSLALVLHVPGLDLNFFLRVFQQPRLPDHRACLQQSDEYQQAGEQRQFPLYLEILAGFLLCGFACWGGWLASHGWRIGLVIAILEIGLLASVLTTTGFCDPLFWRPLGRILTNQNPYRYEWGQ